MIPTIRTTTKMNSITIPATTDFDIVFTDPGSNNLIFNNITFVKNIFKESNYRLVTAYIFIYGSIRIRCSEF